MRYLPLLLIAFVAADADNSVEKITFKDTEIDSLADTLGIMEKSGTVEFNAAERKGENQFAHIEIELYRDGKRLPENMSSGGIVPGLGKGKKAYLYFSFKVVDLDYLTLGGGQKGHCRLAMRLSNGAATLRGTSQDIAKEECNVCKMGSGANFGPKASSKNRIPLFWMMDIDKTKRLNHGNTPEEVVTNNPIGDLAIVSIRLSE